MLQLCLHCINLSARLIFSSEWRRISFSAGFCVEIYKYIFIILQRSGGFWLVSVWIYAYKNWRYEIGRDEI